MLCGGLRGGKEEDCEVEGGIGGGMMISSDGVGKAPLCLCSSR